METVSTNKALASTEPPPPITSPMPPPRYTRGVGHSSVTDSAKASPRDTFLAQIGAQQRHQELQNRHHQPGKILRSVFSSLDMYQRETGQVWAKVGITPSTSSTQQCEKAIRGASLDDLRSVCLGAITTFNTLTQQLTALSKNSASDASVNHFSSTTTSNHNYSGTVASTSTASWPEMFNHLVASIVDRYDGMETAFHNTFISSGAQEEGWGDSTPRLTAISGENPSSSPIATNKLQPPTLLQATTSSSIFSNRQYSLVGSLGMGGGTVDESNAQVESLPSFFLRESPSSNNFGVFRTTSTTSYAGRAPLQFTNNVATKDNDDGFTMINDYVILDELGSGSFGKVMLAFNTKDEKLVAIKGITKGPRLKNLDLQTVTDEVLRSLPVAERRRLQTIQSEIAVMKDLRHQNLVALHEVMDDPAHNQLYLVLQYVDDGVLANVGAGTIHPLVTSVTGLVSACRQIATGLEYLHRHRVLHRDLKPENVLVDKQSNVYIADFGVSESLANKHISENMGTILFTSPELLDLRTSTGPSHSISSLDVSLPPGIMPGTMVLEMDEDDKKYAPDLWALGVMIYYLLYLRLPFETVDSIRNCEVEYPKAELTSWWTDTTDRQTNNPFTAEQLAARRAMVPEMEKLLRRLLEKDPSARATAKEARLALKAVARYIEDVQETTLMELEEIPDDMGLSSQVGATTDAMFLSPSEANFNGESVVKAKKEIELTQRQMKILQGKVSRIRAVCKMAGNGFSSRQQSVAKSAAMSKEHLQSFSRRSSHHSIAASTESSESSPSQLVKNQFTSFIDSMKSLLSKYDDSKGSSHTRVNGCIAVKRNSVSSTLDFPSLNSLPNQLLGADISFTSERDYSGSGMVPGIAPCLPCELKQNNPNACRDEVAELSERVADFRRRVENGENYQNDVTA